jgi:hypothetical protein
MSYVIASPDMMAATATDLATIRSTLGAAHLAAAAPTQAVQPAAAEEVSVGIARAVLPARRRLSRGGPAGGGVWGRAAAFGDQFVENLKASAASYTTVEDAIASFLNSFNDWAVTFQNEQSLILKRISYNLAHPYEYMNNLLVAFLAGPIGSAFGGIIGITILVGGFFGFLALLGIAIAVQFVASYVQAITYPITQILGFL